MAHFFKKKTLLHKLDCLLYKSFSELFLIWATPGLFLFIFVFFKLHFKYKLKQMLCMGVEPGAAGW